jgi:DNA-binding NarL/FixJ family response regulator
VRLQERTPVGIVHQSAIEREGLAALMANLEPVEMVGAASSFDEATRLMNGRPATVVVMDLPQPPETALALVREITGRPEAPRVVALRRHYTRDVVAAAFDAGASACVSTESGTPDLLDAIEAARVGRTYLCPFVARVLIEGPNSAAIAPPVGRQLTHREHEVLGLIAGGNTDRQISGLLGLAVGTVHTHRKHMMAKLGVRNVTSLLRRAREVGLLPTP